MMAEKARLFGDDHHLALILASPSPKEHKRLGRLVQGFVHKRWLQHRSEIVIRGNMAKFGQNPLFLHGLLETGERILVEASPFDRIWGIGFSSEDPRARDPSQWRGLNLLGEALMVVRKALGSTS